MIKVNLTRTKITAMNDLSAIGTTTEAAGSKGNIIFKLFVMFAMIILILGYEIINIQSLESQAEVLNRKAQTLRDELTTAQEKTAPMKEIEDQAKELEDKLGIMKRLSRKRLQTVKSLDFLQTNLPDRMWFRTVQIDDNKMILKGLAATDEDITVFVKALENSVLFNSVLLVRSEMTSTNDGDFKEYEINCNSEVQE